MKKKYIFCSAAVILLFIITVGCQQVFTFSPFSALQRDPATLPADQQMQYAADILAAGDAASMAEAYALINALLAGDPNNGEIHLLAAELAIGASGIGNLVSSLDPSAASDDPTAMFAGLDLEMLANVDAHIQAADSSGQAISDSLYVNAAATIIIGIGAESENGFEGVDWENDPDIERASGYAERGGVDLVSLFGGGSD